MLSSIPPYKTSLVKHAAFCIHSLHTRSAAVIDSSGIYASARTYIDIQTSPHMQTAPHVPKQVRTFTHTPTKSHVHAPTHSLPNNQHCDLHHESPRQKSALTSGNPPSAVFSRHCGTAGHYGLHPSLPALLMVALEHGNGGRE